MLWEDFKIFKKVLLSIFVVFVGNRFVYSVCNWILIDWFVLISNSFLYISLIMKMKIEELK